MMQRKPPTAIEEQRPCLLVQTTDGWLKILDACSGECLRSVFVSSIIKFRYVYTYFLMGMWLYIKKLLKDGTKQWGVVQECN